MAAIVPELATATLLGPGFCDLASRRSRPQGLFRESEAAASAKLSAPRRRWSALERRNLG